MMIVLEGNGIHKEFYAQEENRGFFSGSTVWVAYERHFIGRTEVDSDQEINILAERLKVRFGAKRYKITSDWQYICQENSVMFS